MLPVRIAGLLLNLIAIFVFLAGIFRGGSPVFSKVGWALVFISIIITLVCNKIEFGYFVWKSKKNK